MPRGDHDNEVWGAAPVVPWVADCRRWGQLQRFRVRFSNMLWAADHNGLTALFEGVGGPMRHSPAIFLEELQERETAELRRLAKEVELHPLWPYWSQYRGLGPGLFVKLIATGVDLFEHSFQEVLKWLGGRTEDGGWIRNKAKVSAVQDYGVNRTVLYLMGDSIRKTAARFPEDPELRFWNEVIVAFKTDQFDKGQVNPKTEAANKAADASALCYVGKTMLKRIYNEVHGRENVSGAFEEVARA